MEKINKIDNKETLRISFLSFRFDLDNKLKKLKSSSRILSSFSLGLIDDFIGL